MAGQFSITLEHVDDDDPCGAWCVARADDLSRADAVAEVAQLRRRLKAISYFWPGEFCLGLYIVSRAVMQLESWYFVDGVERKADCNAR
jgi:hypothetical protein